MVDNNPNDGRRRPHNLMGLLNFALESTKNEDAPNKSCFEEMEPERKKFLEEALKSMSVDIIAEMQRICGILMSSDASDDEKLDAMCELEIGAKALYGISGIIRSYEPATAHFIDIGGLECLLSCLSCGVPKICTQAMFMLNAMITDHPMV
ncbi:hypothetical protein Bhyg_03094, partial [Pseudolycoriella hygida]